VLVQLFEEECALKAHLLDPAIEAGYTQARAVIVVFDVGYATP
jgi:hypothetical protein